MTPTASKGSRVAAAARFVFSNFGPLLGFYAGEMLGGLTYGVVVSVVVSIGEIGWRLSRREKLSGLFRMTALLTVGFGIVDVLAQRSVLFRFEATVSNVLVGCYFGASLRGKAVLEGIYEATAAGGAAPKPRVVRYLRGFTAIWTAYFFVKAAFYTYLAVSYPLGKQMAIRSVVGSVSFAVLLVGEQVLRKRLFALAAARGWLGPEEAPWLETTPQAESP